MAQVDIPYEVPVVVDPDLCIRSCRLCVDICPTDALRLDDEGVAYMRFNECWYCLPCEVECPTHALTVNIPLLVR
jgi:NAD-dependent dihydropyrimidine dehydrogenase PreA subunit